MDPHEFVADPAWSPHRYDYERDTLVFARLTKDEQRRITFLDPRFVDPRLLSDPVPVPLLAAARPTQGRIHFIFHTAFCGSTLLARVLDAPGFSMGLKEPAVLADLAHAWLHRRRGARLDAALSLSMSLLARPLAGQETQIAKASNAANHVANLFLQAAPRSRAIVLHSDIETYLFGVVRRGEDGRAFGRRLLLDWTVAGAQTLTPAHLISMTDLQASALAWFLQAKRLNMLHAQYPGRVEYLSYGAFMRRKFDTLERVSAFFDLGADPAVWREKVDGPVFREHAKDLGQPFDERQTPVPDMATAREIQSAASWAAGVARQEGWLTELGDTLLQRTTRVASATSGSGARDC